MAFGLFPLVFGLWFLFVVLIVGLSHQRRYS